MPTYIHTYIHTTSQQLDLGVVAGGNRNRVGHINIHAYMPTYIHTYIHTTSQQLDLGVVAGGNRNRVGSKVARIVQETLKINRTLTSLSLYGNGIGSEGCQALAKVFVYVLLCIFVV